MQQHQFSRRDMQQLTSMAAVFGLFAPMFHVSSVQAAEKQGKKRWSSLSPCRKQTPLIT